MPPEGKTKISTALTEVKQRLATIDQQRLVKKLADIRMTHAVNIIQHNWRHIKRPRLAFERAVPDPIPWQRRCTLGWRQFLLFCIGYLLIGIIFFVESTDDKLLPPKPPVGWTYNFLFVLI